MTDAVVPPAPTGAPVGKIRSNGTCVLLMIVTLGIYSVFWFYFVHEEMKRHTGSGLGGAVAAILGVLVGFIMPFFSSNEAGELYSRRGQQPPVTAVTGLWALLLGWFFFVGYFVWFFKTNNAINEYWRSLGVTAG